MLTDTLFSDGRPVGTVGSLTWPSILWEKCEEILRYQTLNEKNAPVCELEKFVHSVIIVLTSNGIV